MTVSVLWLFLTVPRVGLRCVIVVLTDHTHLHLFIASICEEIPSEYKVFKKRAEPTGIFDYMMIVSTFYAGKPSNYIKDIQTPLH